MRVVHNKARGRDYTVIEDGHVPRTYFVKQTIIDETGKEVEVYVQRQVQQKKWKHYNPSLEAKREAMVDIGLAIAQHILEKWKARERYLKKDLLDIALDILAKNEKCEGKDKKVSLSKVRDLHDRTVEVMFEGRPKVLSMEDINTQDVQELMGFDAKTAELYIEWCTTEGSGSFFGK